MSTLKVNNITDTSGGSTNLTVPNTAKAWVNFNGTGTPAIRASFNVNTITDGGTGKYTVNFTNALVDANYTVSGSGSLRDGTDDANIGICAMARNSTATFSTTACEIRYAYPGIGDSAQFFDAVIATAIFHR